MKKEKIFLIHGLFMHGVVMQYMSHQFEKRGYEVLTFSYRSVTNSIEENAHKLVEFVKNNLQDNDTICHFVGHSLGGILIRLAYEIAPHYFTGRIVTLGTPHQGSAVAKRVCEDIHRGIIGGAYKNALDGELPYWRGEVELGSIAGTKCIGIGLLWREDIPTPNDGTVSVTETQLDNQTDTVTVPLSHTALVYSSRVVEQAEHFLRYGKFLTIPT